ncbi:transposase [Listeria ivanovii]|uniref:transposase n=1 Tax=Listeria ivanovii TaxID=1638 RepID=UPI0023B292CA|nr:transposase [Listeria ivanovii]
MISNIIGTVLPELEMWQSRSLSKFYAFLFVDYMYVTIRDGYKAKGSTVYTILGYTLQRDKEILGLWAQRE